MRRSVVEAEAQGEWELFGYTQTCAMRFANNLLAGMQFANDEEEQVCALSSGPRSFIDPLLRASDNYPY